MSGSPQPQRKTRRHHRAGAFVRSQAAAAAGTQGAQSFNERVQQVVNVFGSGTTFNMGTSAAASPFPVDSALQPGALFAAGGSLALPAGTPRAPVAAPSAGTSCVGGSSPSPAPPRGRQPLQRAGPPPPRPRSRSPRREQLLEPRPVQRRLAAQALACEVDISPAIVRLQRVVYPGLQEAFRELLQVLR